MNPFRKCGLKVLFLSLGCRQKRLALHLRMARSMSNANAALMVFDTPLEIAAAIRQIQIAGCGTNGLSVAWRDQPSQSNVTGYYRGGDRMKYWGDFDILWNEIFEILSGWAVYNIPDIGRILVVGPLADWIAIALANAAIFGSMSAIGMGLYSVGISRNGIRLCEEELKDGKCILMLNGTAQDVTRGTQIINEFGGHAAT
jgi:hypothetical protein